MIDAHGDVWWRDAVVYQIYPRSFADSDGDGIGDLRGIIDHLDHLVALGVDVVWLSPIYPSPQDDAGYDISDYQDVDPTFGTLDDLDELLAALHERGIRLLLDIVVNHTSDEHPWFVTSRADPTGPWRDWYWWRPPRPGHRPGEPGAEPTRWSSYFGGPAWELDASTGEYYLHIFSRKQPDLNWEHPPVREAVCVDDAVVARPRRRRVPSRRDQPGVQGSRPARRPRRSFGDGARPPRAPLHEFMAELRREVVADRPSPVLLVGETPGATLDDARMFTDPPRAELDMVFQFEHVGVDHGPGGKCRSATRWICATSSPRSADGRPGWASPGGTASTGTTTTSRGSCRASVTTASTVCGRRRCSPPSSTCTGGRRTCTRARSSA